MSVTVLAILVSPVCSRPFKREVLRRSLTVHWRQLNWRFLIGLLGSIDFLSKAEGRVQRFMGWETLKIWAAKYGGMETDLPNSGGILGRLVGQVQCELFALSAFDLGLYYNLRRKTKCIELCSPDWYYRLLLRFGCIPVVVLTPFAPLPSTALYQNRPLLDARYGEMKELSLVQFMPLHTLSPFYRVRSLCCQNLQHQKSRKTPSG